MARLDSGAYRAATVRSGHCRALLSRIALVAVLSLSLLEVLENLQNDLNSATARGRLTDDDRSRLLDINGVLAVNLGRERNRKPVDEKELKSTMKEIEKLVKRPAFAREDAVRLDADLDDLKEGLRRRH
jgi:hypothetical protein